ncbi:hypothetical protein AC1031_012850 [Aphanomyces cochlioides]|nr:hypothetical protein AC1031_012850 [Aphanomyces cochlioides]
MSETAWRLGERMTSFGNQLGQSLDGLGVSIADSLEKQTAHLSTIGDRAAAKVQAAAAKLSAQEDRLRRASEERARAAMERQAMESQRIAEYHREMSKLQQKEAKLREKEARKRERELRHRERDAIRMEKDASKKGIEWAHKIEKNIQKAVAHMERHHKTTPIVLKFGNEDSERKVVINQQTPPAPAEPSDVLYRAASEGSVDALVRVIGQRHRHELLEMLEFTDADGFTPLLIAISRGHVNCAHFLLDRGARTAAQDRFGNSALHLACLHGNVAAAALLIRHPRQQSPYTINGKGQSPLEMARQVVRSQTAAAATDVARCIEVLEQRCKVFEGWINHFRDGQWTPRYALVLRTGSPQMLQMALHDVDQGLRRPVPEVVFSFDIHKPIMLKRTSASKPFSIQIGSTILAAFNEAGFDAWSHFLTQQLEAAAVDPFMSPGDLRKEHPGLPSKKQSLHNLEAPTKPPTAFAASAPTWTPTTQRKELNIVIDYDSQQEIAPSAPSPSMEFEEDERDLAHSNREECVVCLDRIKQTVCVPCGHVAVCVPCADKLVRTSRKCPVCRAPVREVVKLFLT